MTFSAVGTIIQSQATTFSLTPHTVGDFILFQVNGNSTSSVPSAMASANATWTKLGAAGATDGGSPFNPSTAQVFLGKVTATSAQTVTISWTGTTPTLIQCAGQEFSSTLGASSVVIDVQGTLNADAGTATWSSLTPAAAGELYFGYALDSGSAVAGSTSGFVYQTDSNSNGLAYNLSCGAGATAPVWGDATEVFGVMVMVREQAAAPVAVQQQPLPPVMFPPLSRSFGPNAPFQVPARLPVPAAVPAAGAATIQGQGSLSTAATVSGGATIQGGGSLSASTAKYITGLAGGGTGYFTDQNGNPRFLLGDNPWALIPNAGRWAGTYQTDIDTYCNTRGGQGYTAIYLDPLGNTENGGAFADGRTWDGIFPFTVNGTAATTAGVSGAATIGLNGTFWTRVDYFLTACTRNGLTAMLNVGYNGPGDFATGAALTSLTSTQFGQYGAALAARYATTPNIIWMVGNDYFGATGGTLGSGGGSPGATDTLYESLLTGLRGGGDTHVISIHNYAESDSREDLGTSTTGTVEYWGNNHAQFNGSYTYNTTYLGIEDAWGEPNPIPVIQLDGYFYQGSSTYAGGTGATAYDRAFRQDAWWAVTSGARGVVQGSESIWQWTSTALASSGTDWFHVHNAAGIRTLTESLAGWHTLQPDTSSVLVTGGRGTRASTFASGGGSGQYEPATTDSFVTASRTPDSGSGSSLALIYLSHATTITIDQTKMVSGYQAYRADPVTGVMTAVTTGATYNSGSWGNNSQGDPDWVLVLQAATAVSGTATITGAGSLGQPDSADSAPGTLTGQGTFSGADSTGVPATITGQGALTPAGSTDSAPATITGTGSVGTPDSADSATGTLTGQGQLGQPDATDSASATLSGAGSIGPPGSTLSAPATLAGQGSIADAATDTAGSTIHGSGTLAPTATTGAPATLSGSGSLADTAATGSAGGIAGSGSVGQPDVTEGTTATITGSGSLTQPASADQAPGTLTGQGQIGPADSILQAPETITGQGSVNASTSPQGASGLTGGGTLGPPGSTLSAGETIQGGGQLATAAADAAPGTLAGRGQLATTSTDQATGTLTGQGQLAAPDATEDAVMQLAGQGQLTGTGTVPSGQSGTITGQGQLGQPDATEQAGTILAGHGTITAAATVTTPGGLPPIPDGITAGAPYSRWSAGEPYGRYSAAAPHG